MPFVTVVATLLAPIHLFAFSALLGTELYQSFVMTKLAYQALPRSAFTTLQKRVFPVYFQGQTSLLGLVALTLPPYGPRSLISSKNSFIWLAVAGFTAVLNLLVYEPKTQDLMVKRIHQGTCYVLLDILFSLRTATRDSGHSSLASVGNVSAETNNFNRAFSRAHAMSIHLNLVTIIATLCYGWQLSRKLQFEVTI